MRFKEKFYLTGTWLLSVRNEDGGWGLNPKQASSIVNTAEALFILNKTDQLPEDLNLSISFLKNAIKEHPDKRGPFLRYYTFGILGLLY